MAVPEQTPYKEYTANGVTTSFPLEFDCENQDHLIVTVNDIEPENGQWSLINGAVVFLIAPANQAKIVIQRNTPLERNTNYQTTNNSFRPQPVNKDFDRIWWKLQELGVTNWLTDTDIKNLSVYVNSLNEETRDEFYNNLGNLEKNTKAMLDEAIKNGAVSALAVITVNALADLSDLSVWEGRTAYVKDVGSYEYKNGKWLKLESISLTSSGGKPDYNQETETGTDNFDALYLAVSIAQELNKRVVQVSSGDYYIKLTDLKNTIFLGAEDNNVLIVGDGKEVTTFWIDAQSEENVFLAAIGGSAWNSARGLVGVTIKTIPSNPFKGIGFKCIGACFTLVSDFLIKNLYVGYDLVNAGGAGSFCEFNTLQNGRLEQNKINRRYLVVDGDSSFHGNNVVNVQNQVKENGGIGVQAKGTSTMPAYLYNQMWLENFFGGTGCIALSLDRMNSDNMWGNLTHESSLIIESKSDYCKFHFKGNFDGIGNITYNIQNENSNGFGVVVFNNTNSLKGNFTNANLSTLSPSLYIPGQQDKNYNGVTNVIYAIGEGVGINVYWNSPGVTITRSDGPNDIRGVTPSFNISANGQTLKSYNYSYNIVNINNVGLQVYDDRIQGTVSGLKIGEYDRRFSKIYLAGLDIDGTAFIPNITATYSLGYSSNNIKDIFLQNAPTVVSDVRYKTDIAEFSEQELNCAVACGKLYRKYKLNAAVDEKGANAARYHAGVIAQEIVKCFIDHDLDWRQYGIITYEKWEAIEALEYQAATYDGNGQELTPEISAFEGREAGEIYMIRYDELNCFINAGLEYRLSQIETKFID
uniref:tail fiber domain-containing protein n=1 Tax=Acinetobacter ursingii TaxID=108980 RepID=UPI003009EC89